MATIRDVAQRAGVSAGTVSNVLNRPSYVSAETRQRVQDAIDELDFAPTKNARQFRPGRERTLGLAVADLGNPFFVDIALAAATYARSLEVSVVLVHNEEDALAEENNLNVLIQQRVHGIMIAPVDERNPRLERLIEQGVPLVYVDRISGERPICFVTTDNHAGGLVAGRHLLERGRRRLALAGGRAHSAQVEERFAGLAEAAGGTGASVERIPTSDWTIEDGNQYAAVWFALPPARRPDGIFAANDLFAIGLLNGLIRRGVKVPDDVSLVGFDDLDWSREAVVPLTSVRQDRETLGRTAVQLLLDEIEQGTAHTHQHLTLQPELTVRASS